MRQDTVPVQRQQEMIGGQSHLNHGVMVFFSTG
jgi:hypothetical protein